MILKIIQMLIILLVGTKNNNAPVYDLRKKPTREDHLKNLNCIFQKYYYIFIIVFLIAIFLVFLGVCFTVVGASGVESGNYYYHLKNVV